MHWVPMGLLMTALLQVGGQYDIALQHKNGVCVFVFEFVFDDNESVKVGRGGSGLVSFPCPGLPQSWRHQAGTHHTKP